jgi:nucleotide-binding universal stress UspA family protein
VSNILVAYNDSSQAKKALFHARNMMEEDDSLIIGWVIPQLKDKMYSKFESDTKVSEARSILKEVVEELKTENISAKSIVKKGEVAENILEIASEYNCKLIVLGYKGVSKIGRFTLGSIVDKVSRLADRPVLIIK